MQQPRALLTVAGTDPSSGAGLQVDLQVFRDFGFHGTSVVTAVLAQNTANVREFEALDRGLVDAQVDALLDDIPVAGVKIGVLAAPSTARAVAGLLERRLGDVPVVLDPVLAGGADTTDLGTSGLARTIREDVFERVSLATPNLPEAEALLDRPVRSREEMETAAEDLVELGADAVLLKAGHLSDSVDSETIRDVLACRDAAVQWLDPLPRVDADVHGTGCQLSSAAVARLARGDSPREAVETSRRYLNDLLTSALGSFASGRPIVIRTEEPADGREEP